MYFFAGPVGIPSEAWGGNVKVKIYFTGDANKDVSFGFNEFIAPVGPVQIERIRAVEAKIAELDGLARAKLLAASGDPLPTRPAVDAKKNVEEFPAVSARFVRFTILATRDGSEPCLDELQIYGAGSDDNFAIGGEASASSLLLGHAAHQVRHLNDGKPGNAFSWISAQRGVGWAQIKLPEARKVSRVVWGRDAAGAFQDRVASAYKVEVSEDGTSWATVATGEDRVGGRPERTFAADVLFGALEPEQQTQRQALVKELGSLRE